MKDIKTKQLICISFLVILSAGYLLGCDGWSGSHSSDDAVTADAMLPVASTGEATLVTFNAARLNGTVNPNGAATTSYFEYGTTTEYGSTANADDIGSGTDEVSVSADIDSLAAFTTYHFRVVAENSEGVAYGADLTFITEEVPEVADAPDATTLTATLVTSDTARLNATINPNGAATTCYFEYGMTTAYGSTTAAVDVGSNTYDIPMYTDIDLLRSNTEYHFRVVATNSEGIGYGDDFVFTTVGKPAATTSIANAITVDSARLNGRVNPNGIATACYFEYGTTAGYGSRTADVEIGSGTNDVLIFADIDTLDASSDYYFRVVAINSEGRSNGGSQKFKTLGAPTATTSPASNVTADSARLNGIINPNGFATTYYFEYGVTASYGLTTTTEDIGSGTDEVAAFMDIDALTAGTIYHFRVVAINSEGIAYGDDRVFGFNIILDGISISAGYRHTVAIKPDGTLWTWGGNWDGQLGDGTFDDRNAPVQIGSDTDWLSVSAGYRHTVAIKRDGTFWQWGWGSNTPGQINTDTDWASVSARTNFTMALKADNTLWAWGANESGQLGDGTFNNSNTIVQISSDIGWSSVSAGSDHTAAIKTDGTLWAWGDNEYHQLGDGTTENRNIPVQIGQDMDWSSVFAGSSYTAAIKTDGTLWIWGVNYGYPGDEAYFDFDTPNQIGIDTDWTSVAEGEWHTIALKTDGTLWALGVNYSGQLGDGTTDDAYSFVQINEETDWAIVSAGYRRTIAVKMDNTFWAWGNNYYGQIGNGSSSEPKNLPTMVGSSPDWLTVAAAYWSHRSAIKTDGSLWAWGSNSYGQLGDGTTSRRFRPQQTGSDTDWASVSVGYIYTTAIKDDGSLWAWGANYDGQLGDATFDDHNVPVQSGGYTDWLSVSAGYRQTQAIKKDGTLWQWGWGISKPWQINTDTDWASVSVGSHYYYEPPLSVIQLEDWYNYSLGLKTDGTLWSWGNGYYGQLGNGTSGYSAGCSTPGQIGIDTKWAHASAGGRHALALSADGSLWSWGNNSYGQLGDGTTIRCNRPQQIGSDTAWASVSAGAYHSIAIKADKTLWAWGDNSSGQLGDGTNIDRNIPVQIGCDSNWACAFAGGCYTTAIKEDGSLWAWGNYRFDSTTSPVYISF